MLEVASGNCHDATEYAGLETALRTLQGVLSVHIDRTRGVAHLGYHPGAVSADGLKARLHAAGYVCDCESCDALTVQPGHHGPLDLSPSSYLPPPPGTSGNVLVTS